MEHHSTNVPATPEGGPYKVRMVPPRPKVAPLTFYQNIPGAFAYPFKKDGVKLLIVGTLLFGSFDFLANFRMGGYRVLNVSLGGLLVAGIAGYMFSYLQSIINHSALGEQHIPAWPEYASWWESYAEPFLRLIAIVAACMTPALLAGMFLGKAADVLIIPLSITGFFYAPMALLAVALDDSLRGLNPLLCLPAMRRVLKEYAVTCLLFAALFCAVGYSVALSNKFLPQFVSQIIGMFFVLYFTIVQARLIGLLYHCKKSHFGWTR